MNSFVSGFSHPPQCFCGSLLHITIGHSFLLLICILLCDSTTIFSSVLLTNVGVPSGFTHYESSHGDRSCASLLQTYILIPLE